MAYFQDCFWEPTGAGIGASRIERLGGRYQAYVPDALVGRAFTFAGTTAADIADAERASAALDTSAVMLADTEAIARVLLRAESVASSRIEGLTVGARRLLNADMALQSGVAQTDVTAGEVLANISTMSFALHSVESGREISSSDLLEAHRLLLEPTRLSEYGGRLRNMQNWIGGNAFNPCNAVFVPPPPDLVPQLFEDLCAFANQDDLPAVAQAAIAHAQFETIHPFVDGNGRVGRVLIHMILGRRGLTTRVALPVSLVLATRTNAYIAGLIATRYVGQSDSAQAVSGLNEWIGTFAAGCAQAAHQAIEFEQRIVQLQGRWRERVGPLRSDAAALKMIQVLPGMPVITAAIVSKAIGRGLRSTLDGIEQLESSGILRAVHANRQRKQVYEAHEAIDMFTDLERLMASPVGDTRIDLPARSAPDRARR